MTTKKETLKSIVDEIFKLDSPKVKPERRAQVSEFITTAVNGDEPVCHLIINASIDKDNKGAIAYILTNLRLIKIDISSKDIKSNSYPLNTIIGVERKLIGDDIQFSISFQNGSFGLIYSQKQKEITTFFQKVEAGNS